MVVTTYCINKGTPSQYYGLKNAEDNTVLHYAPNNWKTEAGAKRWAQRNGFRLYGGKYHPVIFADCERVQKGKAENVKKEQ